jgi:hypothetical protein
MATQPANRSILFFLSLTLLLLIQPIQAAYRLSCPAQNSMEYGLTAEGFTSFCAYPGLTGPACKCKSYGIVECHGSAALKKIRKKHDGDEPILFDQIAGGPSRKLCEIQCICEPTKPGSKLLQKMNTVLGKKLFAKPLPAGREDEPLIRGGGVPSSCQTDCTTFNGCDDVRASILGCQDAVCQAIVEKSAGSFFGLGTCVGLDAYLFLNSGLNGKRSLITDELTCPCNSSFAANACCWEPSGIVQGLGILAVSGD